MSFSVDGFFDGPQRRLGRFERIAVGKQVELELATQSTADHSLRELKQQMTGERPQVCFFENSWCLATLNRHSTSEEQLTLIFRSNPVKSQLSGRQPAGN